MTNGRILCIGGKGAAAQQVLGRLQALGYSVSITRPTGALETAIRVNPDVIISDLTAKPEAGETAAAEKVAGDLHIPMLFLFSEDGSSREDAVGPFDYVTEKSGDRELRLVLELARYRQTINKQLREGDRKPEEVASAFGKNEKAVASITAFRDISGKEKTEEDMLNLKKQEAIGILAGGIAHDFNNLLTAIIGNISFAKMFVPPEDRVFDRLEAAEKAALQAKDLTYQLLVFAKGGETHKKTVSPGPLIRDSADFAASGSNVRCEVSVPDGLSPVEVDTSQLRQVVLNLMTNAREAMPEGGTVTITADNVTLGPGELFPLKEGAYVKISISDHGSGIPAEYLGRIFDPYFSTKEMSARKGTGFGLAVCYSIIRNHGGHIIVESELGKGTVFHIYLPASTRPPAAEVVRREMPLVGTGKVLIMDDEEVIRLVSGNMLDHMGFRVSLARNGEEAIEAYRKAMKKGEPFDVVILDLTVRGGMGGEETVAQLYGIDPGVKAIVSSGYPRDPVMRDFAKHGFSAALPKPYKIEELFDALQSAATPAKRRPSAFSGAETDEEESE
jgi:signal transduction histidine kinase/FixJ family two-component response regulator